jgi:hypothetical protein
LAASQGGDRPQSILVEPLLRLHQLRLLIEQPWEPAPGARCCLGLTNSCQDGAGSFVDLSGPAPQLIYADWRTMGLKLR